MAIGDWRLGIVDWGFFLFSVIISNPINIYNIRAGRKKPGLAVQHLTSVRAAAICNAQVQGDALGSMRLKFVPASTVQARSYIFNVSEGWEAGSTGYCVNPWKDLNRLKCAIIPFPVEDYLLREQGVGSREQGAGSRKQGEEEIISVILERDRSRRITKKQFYLKFIIT